MDLKIGFLLLLGVATIAYTTPVGSKKEKANPADYRVTKNIEVDNYNVNLKLDKGFEKFSGTVTIKFKYTGADTNKLKFNLAALSTTNLVLKTDKDTTIKVTPGTPSDVFETVELTLEDSKLTTNAAYTLEIEFEGKLSNNMKGFYLSSYKNGKNIEQIATTQFEPIYARRAFPCFDEPSLKATFDFTITYPKEYGCLFNTESETSAPNSDDADYITTKFKTTPRMSTYLIAFVISKFESVEQKHGDKSFKVWFRPGVKDTATHAKEEAVNLIDKLEKYTGIDYELNKMDQVAVPDFSAGAMENWGLATYRETALLFDKAKGTKQNMERVSTVIAHEFSHMWFGDLVTLDWWSNTWLNEGFATFFEYHTTGEVHADWDMDNQFVIDEVQTVLLDDGLVNSKPLSSNEDEIYTLAQMDDKFTSISYNKGGSVIRMLEKFYGAENFKKALQTYLKDNKYKNTTPQELLKHFDASAPKEGSKFPDTVENIMHNWIYESGYPVVNVMADDKDITISQNKFLYSVPDTNTKTDTEWYVPISYTTSKDLKFDDTSAKNWVEPGENLTITDALKESDYIIVNLKGSGYYRVNYDSALLEKIKKQLMSGATKIDAVSRSQIIDDCMNLARADIISYKDALSVTEYLNSEKEYYPWASAFTAFNFLRIRLGVESDAGKAISDYLGGLMNTLYKSVSFNKVEDNHIDTLKQVLALKWACELNNEDCVAKSKDWFSQKEIPSEFKSIVYCSALRHDDKNFETLQNKLKDETLASEIITLINALGCTKNVEQLKQYLLDTIGKDPYIRPQDANYAFNAVLIGNPEGVDVALDFIVNHWEDIQKIYGGMNALSQMISSIANRVTTQVQVLKFTEFISKTNLGQAAVQAAAALEQLSTNLYWTQENQQVIQTYFKDRNTVKPQDNGANVATVTLVSLITTYIVTRML